MLLASTGPFGPTPATCLVLLVVLLGPFLLLLLAARSLLSTEPLPRWMVVIVALGGAGLGWLLWVLGGPNGQGFWKAWWAASCAAAGLAPVVLVREGLRRGWFGPWRRGP